METLELSRAELWFCAPDTPAIGEARLFEWEIGGKTRRVWARLVPSKLPPADSEHIGYELFLQEETRVGVGAILKCVDALFFSDEERSNEMVWQNNIMGMLRNQVSRIWRPRNDDRFVVWIHNNGTGTVSRSYSNPFYADSGPFVWGIGYSYEEFVCWSQGELETLLSFLFEDYNSTFRHIYEWCGWSKDERTAYVKRCENGTWDELCFLARSLLILNYNSEEDAKREDLQWPIFYHLGHSELQHDVLGPWSRAFKSVFRPSQVHEDAPYHELGFLHAQRLLPRHPNIQPSAHERLEAFLQLRDWLRANAPEEEARLMGLFPPLSA